MMDAHRCARLSSVPMTYIALLRGINVGGKHKLPMSDLKLLLEQNGCVDVRTYIQSGNVILSSAVKDPAVLEKQITAAISKRHGFAPRVLLLTWAELEKAAAANPFPQAAENPKSLHLVFLDAPPKNPDLKSLESLRTGNEAFALKGKVFYLYTPDGFGQSKLAERAGRLLGVESGTARNWRTVTTLLEMSKEGRS
jgi:uncharacterized protein (DUF1697 family)